LVSAVFDLGSWDLGVKQLQKWIMSTTLKNTSMQELVGYDGLNLSQWDRTLDPKMTRTLNIESKEHLIGVN